MIKDIDKSGYLLIITLAYLLISSSIFAQAPQKMSYQAVIRNTNGALVASTSVGMKISIIPSLEPASIAVYSETQTASTNANGLASIQIGSGTVVTGTFAGINWENGPYFIKVAIDPLGGTNYTIVSSDELMSVPYALFSANGITGPAGAAGATGPQGPIGLTGANGLAGPIGLPGTNGTNGLTGPQGPIGLSGTNGTNGLTGPQGPIGLSGTNGTNGSSAYQAALTNGFIGTEAQWLASLQGATGPQGATGTFTSGTVAGGMNYWNGTAWVTVAPGLSLPGNQVQTLGFCNGVPTWGPCPAVLPTITTIEFSLICINSASIGADITSDGGALTVWGVCWSTSVNPTLADSYSQYLDSLSSIYLSDLIPNTTYYVRAYATNIAGTAYGNQLSFTTPNLVITTTAISSIDGCSAISGGQSDICNFSSSGICWNTSVNPTIANNTSQNANFSLTSYISGLVPNTTYYVRSYFTYNGLNYYGNQLSFTTATLCIGQVYQGGKVAYILQAGDPGYNENMEHGLIAQPGYDNGGIYTAPWGCVSTAISGADGYAIGTGAQNTIDIMNGCSEAGIAARICGDLVLGGFSDWYLPSKDELNKLYINRDAIGDFTFDWYWDSPYYWSSTEFQQGTTLAAWKQNFYGGSQEIGYRGYLITGPTLVRAVRAF